MDELTDRLTVVKKLSNPFIEASPAEPKYSSFFWRYGMALVSCSVALLISLLFPNIFLPNPFLLFFLAIVISVISGGLLAGLIAIVFTILTVNYFLITPDSGFSISSNELVRFVVFAAVALLISWVIETRRRAEMAVTQHREWLRVTLTSIGDGVIATDTQARVMFLNEVAEALTGWKPDDASGQPIATVFHIVNQKTGRIVENPVNRVLKEGVIVGLANDTVLISRTGSERMIADSGAPIRDRSGNTLGSVLVFRDVTDDYAQAALIRENEQRLRTVLSSMPVMLIATDAPGNLVAWNKECERVTGYSAEEMVGNPQYIELLYPDPDYRRQIYEIRKQEGPTFQDWELEITHKDGRKRTVSWSNVSGGFSVPGWTSWGIGIDITGRKRAESRAAGLQALTAALSEALTPQAVAEVIVEKGFPLVGSRIGSISLLEPDGKTVRILNMHTVANDVRENFMELARSVPTHVTDAIQTRQPVWVKNLEDYRAKYPEMAERLQSVTRSQAIASLPLISDGRVLGAIGMSFPQPRRFDAEDREFLQTIASQCAQAMQRALLYEAEQLARRRVTFLAEASAVLSSSLDYQITLKNMAQLAVPMMADWCRIDLVNEQGELQLVEVAHVDPEKVKWVRSLEEKYPPNPHSARGIHQVIKTGETEYYADLSEDVATAAARDEEEKQILRQLGFKSVMIVPMSIRGSRIGAVTFVSSESGRHFSQDDVALAREIGHRSAVAVDNARLFAQARQAAVIEERQRFSRDLHDAVSQTLFSANIIAQTAARMWTTKPESVPEWLDKLQRMNQGALAEMRTLLLELRPEGLHTSSLPELLRQLADAVQARREIDIALEVTLERMLPPNVHEMLYRVTQEALNNVVKHSEAAKVEIACFEKDDCVMLVIHDDGPGFDVDMASRGFGLNIMQERAEGVGAAFSIKSQMGDGTEIVVTWQIPHDEPIA
ncbi:MAG: PAS domain S-box protein [Chloroflexota bacterium]